MIWAVSILFALYALCLGALFYGFWRLPNFSAEGLAPQTRFSVVVPFRNEAENLPALLKTIENLTYPSELFEVNFVNDASEDTSEAIISAAMESSKFSLKILQNKRISNAPKKDAISEAIKNSKFEWIVTTDADCVLPKYWLKTLDAYIQKNNPTMVCGPVIYESNGSFIENFQQMDGLSLQAATLGSFGLGSPMLCNGANLAYQKDVFIAVGGFSGNEHLASGDDIFLMDKWNKAFPKQVQFLKSKEAIVSTKPQTTWKNVVDQRIRWASKTSRLKNPLSLLVAMLVFLANVSFLAFPVLMILDTQNLGFYLLLTAVKIMVDYVVMQQNFSLFGNKFSFWKFLGQTYVYALMVLIVTLGSFRGHYSWKGRTFKKQC